MEVEVVASEQVWRETDDNDLVFDHIRVILRNGPRYFFARQQDRYARINFQNLALEEIPDTFLYAPLPADLTRAPEPLPANCYLKRPNLLEYGETKNCCTVLLQEAKVYEILRLRPHKNIAEYHGCVVENGIFRGICLQWYPANLKQREEALSVGEKERVVQGIRDGVAHLHTLGLVHNDLNPSNIMIAKDGAAVIVDFDSCRPIGKPMGIKGSTPGWEVSTECAVPDNDLHNLDKIERYLLGFPTG